MDILDCLANLSNDEVFTSPAIANRMLDTLPDTLWSDPNAKFLDPFTKSGVFLREIAKRLMQGLATAIPDRQARLDHILGQQLYGIAITQLTALTARRTLYCNKDTTELAHCLTDVFAQQGNPDGNIYFEPCEHTFVKGKCTYCGATEREFGAEQRSALEQHAYLFIHNKNPYKEMQFDVIIGNPPYQMSDGSGGSSDSAVPIYNKFVEQAIMLNPRYLCMIIPSKWMVGGRGLKKFRENMVENKKIKILYDFENSKDCFPGQNLDGGVCYFLLDREYKGETDYIFRSNDGEEIKSKRFLKNNYFEYIIRNNRVLSIIEESSSEESFSKIVSQVRPYGIRGFLFNTPERYPNSNLSFKPFEKALKIYGVKGIKGGAKRIIGYISRDIVTNGFDSIDKYKLFFTTSYSTNAINPPEIIKAQPNEICTETFLLVGPFDTENEQLNCLKYMNTKFFKFLLYLGKGTMHVTKSVFGLIPLQDFTEEWTDEKLYRKYGLTAEEIAYIEKMVRPME
ncbi:Eco57I restriction-modification methylase domain-containing protein [Capnocytophaga sp. Marseille-Q4570]|uniref:site-specific DNA-methyltransferase (adenine-specific) n=1 Tax=Capnocytophaga bilenii TaxID=2819369 RepID=A0ABS3PWJ8_9FLAO|nr:Eco57I restriction-modification methylase domain-containing protein [Capnocytophaga bilenii]MBO1883701.1 Eco57I restriction-modification methylase domain-containing protein [Capnocytophaga bilenii]